MSWIGKRVRRNRDNAEGVIIKFDNGHLDPAARVTVKMTDNSIDAFHMWAWAVPPPNGWAVWFDGSGKWRDFDNVGR